MFFGAVPNQGSLMMTKVSDKLWRRKRAWVARVAGGIGRPWLPALLGVVLLAVLAPAAAAQTT
jgi:hypothetical protein